MFEHPFRRAYRHRLSSSLLAMLFVRVPVLSVWTFSRACGSLPSACSTRVRKLGPAVSALTTQKCENNPIRMMIGIGMPISQRSIERMSSPFQLRSMALRSVETIPLTTTNCCGETRRESADQKRDKRPQRRLRRRAANLLHRFRGRHRFWTRYGSWQARCVGRWLGSGDCGCSRRDGCRSTCCGTDRARRRARCVGRWLGSGDCGCSRRDGCRSTCCGTERARRS